MAIKFWQANFAILILEEVAVIIERQFFCPSLSSLLCYLGNVRHLAVLRALALEELSFNLLVYDFQLLPVKVDDYLMLLSVYLQFLRHGALADRGHVHLFLALVEQGLFNEIT